MRAAVLRSLAGVLAVVGALLVLAVSARAATFQSGDGISVVSQSVSGREVDLQVTTTAVQGTHEVIALLPEGYDANTATRYPVLYLFHGALAGPSAWVVPPGAAPQITDPYPIITVIPDAGVKGWNTDWVNGYELAPQSWLDFLTARVLSVWAVTSDPSGWLPGWRRADPLIFCQPAGVTYRMSCRPPPPGTTGVT